MNRAERRRLGKSRESAASEALLHEAARHHRVGALAEAEVHYRAFLAASPQHSQAMHLLGLVCQQTGRPGEAARLIADAEKVSPQDTEIPYNLGISLMMDGRPAEAADAFRRALALKPGRPDALNNLGTALQRLDRLEEAIAAYQGALDSEPGRVDSLSNMAHALQALGRREEAVSAYRQVLMRQPGHATARHMVAAMTGETPAAAPDDFVRHLFDSYAERFEAHLTGALAYDPARVVESLRHAAGPETRFAAAADLGCGTGLAGAALRPFVDRLTGIDLSPGMVARAEAKKIYDALSVAAIEPFLAGTTERFDLFVATDVFIYVGAVEGVFAKAAARARPNAWFAFSAEEAEGDGFVLRPTGRYAHSLPYLARTLAASGWDIRSEEALTVRLEGGTGIPGRLIVAQLR